MQNKAQNRVSILGTGHALPLAKVTSEMLDSQLGFKLGHLARVSGVNSRFVCKDESQIDMAVIAAHRALARANVPVSKIDLVISASGIPYQTLPSTAPLIMRGLGLKDGQAAAFDINSTCLSFLSALDVAADSIRAGRSHTALVVSSEIASRALPWQDSPDVAALFGDGAGAAVLGAGPNGGIIASHMRSYPSAYEACQIAAGGTRIDFHNAPDLFATNARFKMDGKELYRLTSKHFRRFLDDLLEKAGWHRDDVDVVIPHQASPHALARIGRVIGFPKHKLENHAAQIGNQIAASIPIVLDMAIANGKIAPGAKVLMLGTSAGVSFGGMAYEAPL